MVHVSPKMIISITKPPPSSTLFAPTRIHGASISTSSWSTMAMVAAAKPRRITCSYGVAVKQEEVSSSSSPSSPSNDYYDEELEREAAKAKIGARVRIKVPLKVYHVPRVPEIDLTGMEGVMKQYVGIWKGKRISANLPYKVEFVTEVEGRSSVKFFAHLKDDEFEYLD